MTFSEFGRRVKENGSRGTDHGAASCLFVAGPSVKGGVVGKHPSLADLDADDLKYPHRLPPRLRDAARRLARLRQQGRAGREVGSCQGVEAQGLIASVVGFGSFDARIRQESFELRLFAFGLDRFRCRLRGR